MEERIALSLPPNDTIKSLIDSSDTIGNEPTQRRILILEPFEWLGLVASSIAVLIFFTFAHALDVYAGIAGYHWQVLGIIGGIYLHFIPYALVVGTALLALWAWRRPQSRVSFWQRYAFAIRVFLAYCVLLIIFRVVNFYVPVIHPGIRDAVIQRMDARLLGGRQIGDWLEPWIHPWLTHIATGAYVSWFWLLFATLVLMVTVSRQAASEYVFASLIVFYVGYLCYIFIPVVGPGYTIHFSEIVGDIAPRYQNTAMVSRDCFPSLHTALSVLMVWYVGRYRRSWLWFYLPLACLIVFATLYLRFHYASDDIAGAALGTSIALSAPALLRVGSVITKNRRTKGKE